MRQIFLSPGHNYFGRHGLTAEEHPALEVERAECVASSGLRGDRFFGFRPGYKGQITLFSEAILADLKRAFDRPNLSAGVLRRNFLVSGVDLNSLIGVRFDLQGVQLEGVEECRPCYWMDQAVAPGAEEWLRGRGGLRCRVLSSGWILRTTYAEAI